MFRFASYMHIASLRTPHYFLRMRIPASKSCLSALRLMLLPLFLAATHAAPPGTVTPHIKVDQFGYLPEAQKIAVISDPQVGFNAAESYIPGVALEVRRATDHSVAYSARAEWRQSMVV
jgi:hypothetical protein